MCFKFRWLLESLDGGRLNFFRRTSWLVLRSVRYGLRWPWHLVRAAGVGFLAGVLLPATAVAFSFKPTPAEWAAWPPYCKARYVTLEIGKQSPYAAQVPPATIQTWQARLGQPVFVRVHHYCAGLAYVQRSTLARSERERAKLLKAAENEVKFTLDRLPVTNPLYREVAGTMQYIKTMRVGQVPAVR